MKWVNIFGRRVNCVIKGNFYQDVKMKGKRETLLGLVVLLFSSKREFGDRLVSPLRKVSSCGFIRKCYFEEGSTTNWGSLRLLYCISFN